MVTAQFFIDYQNLHNTAHETFGTFGQPIYDSLIQPGLFADEVAARWKASQGTELDVKQIDVFRGLPSPRKEAKLNKIINRHRAAWMQDPRVVVRTRALRYPTNWPNEPAQEKGIDVMLALALVTAAIGNKTDVFVLVTRDTDLIPAVDLAQRIRPGKTAIATWEGSSVLRPQPPVVTIQLNRAGFEGSRDETDYDY